MKQQSYHWKTATDKEKKAVKAEMKAMEKARDKKTETPLTFANEEERFEWAMERQE
jgi:hypothetical protein